MEALLPKQKRSTGSSRSRLDDLTVEGSAYGAWSRQHGDTCCWWPVIVSPFCLSLPGLSKYLPFSPRKFLKIHPIYEIATRSDLPLCDRNQLLHNLFCIAFSIMHLVPNVFSAWCQYAELKNFMVVQDSCISDRRWARAWILTHGTYDLTSRESSPVKRVDA
jgi:hypothetical protein